MFCQTEISFGGGENWVPLTTKCFQWWLLGSSDFYGIPIRKDCVGKICSRWETFILIRFLIKRSLITAELVLPFTCKKSQHHIPKLGTFNIIYHYLSLAHFMPTRSYLFQRLSKLFPLLSGQTFLVGSLKFAILSPGAVCISKEPSLN